MRGTRSTRLLLIGPGALNGRGEARPKAEQEKLEKRKFQLRIFGVRAAISGRWSRVLTVAWPVKTARERGLSKRGLSRVRRECVYRLREPRASTTFVPASVTRVGETVSTEDTRPFVPPGKKTQPAWRHS